MFKLNRKVEYGLMAVKFLRQQQPDSLHSAREIAEASNAPFDLMAKVLQKMHKEGLIASVQGTRGGYRLTVERDGSGRLLDQVSLAEFIETLGGPVTLADCLNGHPEDCERLDECTIREPLSSINKQIRDVLDSTTLAQFTADGAA